MELVEGPGGVNNLYMLLHLREAGPGAGGEGERGRGVGSGGAGGRGGGAACHVVHHVSNPCMAYHPPRVMPLAY